MQTAEGRAQPREPKACSGAPAVVELQCLGGTIGVRGLTVVETDDLKARFARPDGDLDLGAFEREQFRLCVQFADGPMSAAQVAALFEQVNAGTWRRIIDTVENLSEKGFRRPPVSGTYSALIAYAAKVDHYRPERKRSEAVPLGATRGRTSRARSSHSARPGHRRCAASSSTSSSDPGSSSDPDAPGEAGYVCDCGCGREVRSCDCGCGRDITHRRRDTRTFGASCRQRLRRSLLRDADLRAEAPLDPRTCQCESGFFFRDPDGDAVCALCGCWLAKVEPRPNGFDAADALLRSNGSYTCRRRVPREWRTRRTEVAL